MIRLSTPLQISNLKRLFTELNPDADPQEIDFNSIIGSREKYEESLEFAKEEYPAYTWSREDSDYKGVVISELNNQAKQYGLKVVSSKELSSLKRRAEEASVLAGKLKLTEAAIQRSEAKLVQKNASNIPEKEIKPSISETGSSTWELIERGLHEKPLLIVSARSGGKTVIAKHIIGRINGKFQIRCFDPCFDAETDVLTINGWKQIKDVSLNESVATLNRFTNKIEYQKVYYTTHYTSPFIYEYSGHNLSFSVTPNHRFYVKIKKWLDRDTREPIEDAKYNILTAEELSKSKTGNRFYIPRCADWISTNIDIPEEFNSLKYFKFLGLFLAEGYAGKKGIAIDQSLKNTKKIEAIRRIIKDFYPGFKEYNCQNNKGVKYISFRINNTSISKNFQIFGKSNDKYIPRYALMADKKHLAALFGALMLGDGSCCAGAVKYHTSSKQLANDVQELIFKLGFIANITTSPETPRCHKMYIVSIIRKKYALFNKNNLVKKEYNKEVYCISVPNEIIYVRYRGKPFWSMNSLAWWRSSPLSTRVHVEPKTWVPNLFDAVYDVGGVDGSSRLQLITMIVGGEYRYRYEATLRGQAELLKPDLTVVEEGQSIFDKWSRLPDELHDWVSVGRNYGMTGIIVTQRPAEIDTKVVERCDLLVGYCEGDNNLKKIRNATSKDFMERVKRIKIFSHDFLYFNGSIREARVDDPVAYPDPVNSAVREEKKSWWKRVFG